MLPWEIRVTSLISDAGDLSSCYSAGSAGGIYTVYVVGSVSILFLET